MSSASAPVAAPAQPSLSGGEAPGGVAATPVVHGPGGAPFPASAAPTHAAQGTTVQLLARRLRLVVTGGIALPPLEVDTETIVGRGEGPFAMLLDPFHDKGLSRRHCQFRRGATGTWSIVDLAGRGSTFVSADGTWSAPPVGANASHLVEPGRDQVRLGLLTFKVEAIT
ncbi:MAG: FHA domain-containing protein [Gemmatimonadota bacterium]